MSDNTDAHLNGIKVALKCIGAELKRIADELSYRNEPTELLEKALVMAVVEAAPDGKGMTEDEIFDATERLKDMVRK